MSLYTNSKTDFVNGKILEFPLTPGSKLVLRETFVGAREWIDLRKWVKIAHTEDWVPLKKTGFLLTKDMWKDSMIPGLLDILSSKT